MSYTAIIQKVEEGYIGFVEEIPGANTQAATIEEVRENLREAIQLVLESNRAFLNEIIADKNIIRAPINFSSYK